MRKSPEFHYVSTDALHFLMNGIAYWIISAVIVVALSGIFEYDAHAQINTGSSPIVQINDGDEWYYFKGLQDMPQDWNHADLDVSNWQAGASGVGYGTSSSRTYLEDMQGNYSTVYLRKDFQLDNPAAAAGMTLSVVCDGPFIAYLNGVEMIQTKTFQISTLEFPIGVADIEQYNVSGFIHELVPGKNVLALQCVNDNINSEDFSFIPVFEVYGKGEAQ